MTNNDKNSQLQWTGERYLPEVKGMIELEHYHRYLFSLQFCKNKTVLDIASGEGYGTYLLSQQSKKIIGVDIDKDAIGHAKNKYEICENITFIHGSCLDIPVSKNSIDVVVSFETIEHIYEHEIFLREIKRVLKKDGILVISTPDKYTYTDIVEHKNIFHKKELYKQEFENLISTFFKNNILVGQKITYGSTILGIGNIEKYNIDYYNQSNEENIENLIAHKGINLPLYLISVASDNNIAPFSCGFLEQPIIKPEQLSVALDDLRSTIENKEKSDERNSYLEKEIIKSQNYIKEIEYNNLIKDKELTAQNRLLADKNNQISNLNNLLLKKDEKIKCLTNQLSQDILKVSNNINKIDKKINENFILNPINLLKDSYFNIFLWKQFFHLRKHIKETLLFDKQWYLKINEDVQKKGISPLQHFVFFGVKEERSPSPYFDTRWYMDENQDIKISGLNPLLHYLTVGFKEGRKPNPLFWPNWYKEKYLNTAPKENEPFLHYLTEGYKKGFQPCPYFDPEYYIAQHENYWSTDQEPLQHYLHVGWRDGKKPSPYFNPTWYNNKNKDVYEHNIEPLTHYISKGWKENRNPNEYFFVHWYLNKYLKNKLNIEPLLHYISEGSYIGANPNPYFDTDWYKYEYLLDSNDNNLNPLCHYMEKGWILKNNPNPYFDSQWYSQRYPDVSTGYQDSFVHFIEFGIHEQRQPNKYFDYSYYKKIYQNMNSESSNTFLYFLENDRDNLERPFDFPKKPSYSFIKNWNDPNNYMILSDFSEIDVLIFFDMIVVTYNSEKWIDNFFESILPFSNFINLIIVDNNSSDSTVENINKYKNKFDRLTVEINNSNLGFGHANNIGSKIGESEFLLFLNIDTVIKDLLFFNKLISIINDSQPDVAAWEFRQAPYEHPKIYNPVTLETGWISGAGFTIKRKAFEEIGGFDENLFMYCEDVDLSWRLRAKGYKLLYCPHLLFFHYCYKYACEIKPTAHFYGILHNYFLRLRYGSDYDIIVGRDLFINHILKYKGNIKDKSNFDDKIRYFSSTKILKNEFFMPTFFNYDYDVVRDGAFYEINDNQSNSLVSIIIRTIGNLNFLKMALISVLNQTHDNTEIIVVEDGGNTAQQLLSDFNTDKIKYFPINKSGRCIAGNVGLENSSGIYINFLDEDDLLFCDHVEILSKKLDENISYGAAWSSSFCVKTDLTNCGSIKECSYKLLHNHDIALDEIYSTNQFPIQAVMFRRECYEKHGGFDPELDMLEDWDLWITYYKYYKFLQIKKTTSLYRVPFNQQKHQSRQNKLNLFYNKVRNKHLLEI